MDAFHETIRRHRPGKIGGTVQIHHFMFDGERITLGGYDNGCFRSSGARALNEARETRQHAVEQQDVARAAAERLQLHRQRADRMEFETGINERLKPRLPLDVGFPELGDVYFVHPDM